MSKSIVVLGSSNTDMIIKTVRIPKPGEDADEAGFRWSHFGDAGRVHEELKNDNRAAALSFGGMLVALAIVVLKGISGPFIGWAYLATTFAATTLVGIILLPLIRILFDKLLIPGADLNKEIMHDRNAGIALVEAVVCIAFAILYFVAVDIAPLLEEISAGGYL